MPQSSENLYKPGYKLIFYDDFNNPTLNTTKWITGYTWGQCLPGSLAYFSPEGNYSLNDGYISLTAKKEVLTGYCGLTDSNGKWIKLYQNYNYTSGVITSKKTFKYGYFECRFKVPRGKGFNAAFWLFGARRSEIDVFEIMGSKPSKVHTTLHWEGKDPKTGSTQWYENSRVKPAFDTAFHSMSVLWTPQQIIWFVDGKVLKSRKQSKRVWKRHIPDTELNMILDLGVGIIDSAPDTKTVFPAHFIIDHVAAYALESNDVFRITAHKNINLKLNSSFKINFDDLIVENTDKQYPAGYKLTVLPGENYRVKNNLVSPSNGFKGKLSVPVFIDDGIKKSNTFNFELRIGD